jgi:hypothetical protein
MTVSEFIPRNDELPSWVRALGFSDWQQMTPMERALVDAALQRTVGKPKDIHFRCPACETEMDFEVTKWDDEEHA